MKKIFPLILLVILIVGGAVGYLLYSKSKDEDKDEDKTESSQDRGEDEDEETFTLIVEEGNVLFKEDENDKYQSVDKDEIELNSGSFVKTTENSFAQIILPSNSVISIDQSTEIQIKFEESSTKVDQLLGNTWHRVKSLTEDDTYEVKTPNTIASVRGTIFSIGVAKDENDYFSTLLVEDSKVQVSKYEEEDGDIKIIDEVDVGVGDYVEISKDDELAVEDIPENIQDAYWYTRNVELDKQIYNDLEDLNIKDFKEVLDENSILDYDFELESSTNSILDNPGIPNQIPGLLPTGNLGADYDYSEFCTYYSGEDFISEEYFETVTPYFDASYVDLLRRYFTEYSNACSDGKVDSTEWSQILEISNEFQNIDYNTIYKY